MIEMILGALVVILLLVGGGMFALSLRDGTKEKPPGSIDASFDESKRQIEKLEKEVFEKADLVKQKAESQIIPPVEDEAHIADDLNDTAMMKSITKKVEKVRKQAGL